MSNNGLVDLLLGVQVILIINLSTSGGPGGSGLRVTRYRVEGSG